jgi:DNA-binding CsgD family transcriptional regulator
VALAQEASAAPGLLGRDVELQAVRGALLPAVAPVAIVLEGEAGIGKTALWRAGVAEAESRGMRPRVARPVEAETGLSHAALGDLLSPLVDELGESVPAPQRRALDVALLRETSEGAAVDQHAVGAATLAALRAAAAEGPLLVAIDDVQWLDPASAAALRFALRRLEEEPVVLFATRRAAPDAEAPDVGFGADRLVRIGVGPLEADALQRLLQRRVGESFPWPALVRLAELSGGNPYYALELARAAVRQAGEAGAVSAQLALPDGIYAVLQDRLAALPPESMEALGTLAAMAHPTIAGLRAALDPGALDDAFAAGVVHEEGETIRFEHPLLAEAAYRMLPPSRRQRVHERLAEGASDAEERARHLAAASSAPDAGVAAEIEKGAHAAAARGARAAAAELLEASAQVEPDQDQAARRRIAAVRQHRSAGDGRRARLLASALIEELPAGPLRARALVVMAEGEGVFEELTEFARQAAAEAGDDHEVLIEALLLEGVLLLIAERTVEARAAFLRAKELCGPDTPRDLYVQAVGHYADLAHVEGEPGGMELLREAAQLEGDDLIPNAHWGPGTIYARALLFADELDSARTLLEGRYRRAVEAGDDDSRSGLLFCLAELEMRAGRFDPAMESLEEGLAVQAASYGEDAQGFLVYGCALLAVYQGDVELARGLAQRGLAQTRSQGDGIFLGATETALGQLELALGNNAAAVEWFGPVAEKFIAGRGGGEPGLRRNVCVPDAVEALTGVGRLEDAEELLAAWEQAGERFDRPRIHATASRCRALLAAARGDLDAALEHAEAALRHHDGFPVPLERARTQIVLGSIQRRGKQRAAARASLEEALASLEAIGARLWAKRARAELGRIGGRAASGGLTPTERRVADLVSEGRSNKEVAEALFVSVRTVEANLTRVYAKLGIRSRTELAATRPASDGRSRSPAPPPARPS